MQERPLSGHHPTSWIHRRDKDLHQHDGVRVIGNNAVHPGKMDRADVEEVSSSLFALVNLIVENRITQPKMVADVFAGLPESTRQAIEKRDGKQPQG
ncbi:hypothetical protein [Paraburkholderia fungorum]|uniref:hypothetical protein n=1 Tax=Paraburkholderia fungorum TaxID=134537 RepID=UPI0011EA6A24|nr:hypothetical protein [Paraburkholderia fungorum]